MAKWCEFARGGIPMILRMAKTGKHVGQQFWDCSTYPESKGAITV